MRDANESVNNTIKLHTTSPPPKIGRKKEGFERERENNGDDDKVEKEIKKMMNTRGAERREILGKISRLPF